MIRSFSSRLEDVGAGVQGAGGGLDEGRNGTGVGMARGYPAHPGPERPLSAPRTGRRAPRGPWCCGQSGCDPRSDAVVTDGGPFDIRPVESGRGGCGGIGQTRRV